jgi:hypothetical protein
MQDYFEYRNKLSDKWKICQAFYRDQKFALRGREEA